MEKAAYAILEMEAEIDDEAVYKEYEMTSNDTRQDAYRHIIMNALLGQGITPPFLPKHPVWDFAKKIADWHEDCGCNEVDGKEMDYHNNAIGRQLFADNTNL